MKKTDWTDRMLAALVELYPVETTAYTAAVLNLSESTVKQKARELGLVKMAKSRWMERADYIRNHFQECSFSEIGKALGITRMSVGRIAAALGLKRSSEEKHLISSRIRTQMVKRERRRIVFGLEPITGIRVISNRAKVRVRSNMKSNGYIISEEHNVIYYTGTTERRERLESRGIRLGLHILPFPEDCSAFHPTSYYNSHAVRTDSIPSLRGNGILLCGNDFHGLPEGKGRTECRAGQP